MAAGLTRRRFLSLAGVAAACVGTSGWATAKPPVPVTWRGQALGAEADLTLYHPDPDEAAAIIEGALGEVARLERLFSLYRSDSALSALNRDGSLTDPPREFLDLLRQAQAISALSGGAFDVTVQPLWSLYASHFAKPGADPAGPSPALVSGARARVGWQGIDLSPRRVALRDGMAVTLNGIAQGFITDAVTDYLAARGITATLVNMGEYRALGSHPDGRPWHLGIPHPADPARLLASLDLRGRAASTSAGLGTAFDAQGRFHHLFEPSSGRPASAWASVTVVAPTATLADALSTAIAAAPPDRAAGILRAGGGLEAWLLGWDRKVTRRSLGNDPA
ncbi:FAD:protein FMN transferase [Aerophototrophica crusticola]|uniref:FAD:protein FMN transferase n=1 Tax=Aerophototrophica crusticola TaxID=1709002 RepID=A0A858RD47_9PROT|nr:FAD:protein FMN transferase [Rhodospirillaceae bacterium B3]